MEIVFFWMLAVIPGLLYPALLLSYRRILRQKYLEIEQLLSRNPTLKAQYHQVYGAPTARFETSVQDLLDFNFGWAAYALPLIMTFLIPFGGTVLGLLRGRFESGLDAYVIDRLNRTPSVLLAGLAGAYIWGLYDSIRRYRLVDLSPAALNSIWLRLLLTPAVALLLSEAANDTIKDSLAFAVGVFPVKTLEQAIQALAIRRFGLAAQGLATAPEDLGKLQGVTPDILDRLSAEGVSNTEQLAYSDPIKLLLRTNLEWTILLDLMDQALLYVYLGDRVLPIRSLGIRGAIEAAEHAERLTGRAQDTLTEPEKITARLAARLELEPEEVLSLLQTLSSDGQVEFLQDLWGESTGGEG